MFLRASSIESTPDVASRPVDRGVAEPEKEAVSISGRQNDEEEEVAVSYGDLHLRSHQRNVHE